MKKKRLAALLQELEIDLECFKSHCNASRKRIVMLESQVQSLYKQMGEAVEDLERINERLAIMDGDVKLPQLFDESDDDFNEYGEDVK